MEGRLGLTNLLEYYYYYMYIFFLTLGTQFQIGDARSII